MQSPNDALCDELCSDNLIRTPDIERAFRAIDRGNFLTNSNHTYDNRPVKEGLLHLSAPYMYAQVMEELELEGSRSSDTGTTVLNVGSGTGYFSSLVAHVIGETGSVHGVEVNPHLVQHAKARVAELNSECHFMADIQFICGNCFQLSPSERQYDRIYVGAGAKNSMLPFMLELLAPGGILVGPFDSKLLKIVKTHPLDSTGLARSARFPSSRRQEPGDRPAALSLSISGEHYHTTTLSYVAFAPLQSHVPLQKRNGSSKDYCIRFTERVWSPDGHHKFPDAFRQAVRTVLMISQSLYHESYASTKCIDREKDTETAEESTECDALTGNFISQHTYNINDKSAIKPLPALPVVVWEEVLSFMGRDWFRCGAKGASSSIRCRGPIQALLRGVRFTLKRSVSKLANSSGSAEESLPDSRRRRQRRSCSSSVSSTVSSRPHGRMLKWIAGACATRHAIGE